jgi:hypothetical protein
MDYTKSAMIKESGTMRHEGQVERGNVRAGVLLLRFVVWCACLHVCACGWILYVIAVVVATIVRTTLCCTYYLISVHTYLPTFITLHTHIRSAGEQGNEGDIL